MTRGDRARAVGPAALRYLACLLLALLVSVSVARAEVVFIDSTYTPEGSALDLSGGDGGSTDEGGGFVDEDGERSDSDGPQAAAETAAPRVFDENGGWPREIVITVGGDCTLGTTDYQRTRSDGFDSVVAEKGLDWPFSELARVFAADDLTLVNFEGALTESGDKVEKLYNFKGPATYAMMLTLGSVEAVTLANNHFGDYGAEGRADTKAALDAEGIVYCAPGETAIYEVRGVKIGLIGNTFAYKNGKCDISADVKALREAGCQLVIASFHWGSEYETAFTRDQRNIGRAAIEAGADAVIGHHPHVIQGVERYEGTYILYSLANLVFGGNLDPDQDKRDTFVAQLTFTVYEDGQVEGPALKLIPMRLTAQEKGTDYRPVFAEGEAYDRILKVILNRSYKMEDFVNPE